MLNANLGAASSVYDRHCPATGEDGQGESAELNGAHPADAEHFDDNDEFEELYGDAPPAPHPVAEMPAADPDAAADGEDVEVEAMAAHDGDAHANGDVAEGGYQRPPRPPVRHVCHAALLTRPVSPVIRRLGTCSVRRCTVVQT